MQESAKVRKDALQIIAQHISVASICLMTNNILDWPLQSESLSNQWLDKDGSIWFLSFRHSEETVDTRMEVFYSNRAQASFLSLVGHARAAVWNEASAIEGFPFAKHNVKRISTPIRLVRFFPEEAYYWDDTLRDMVPLVLDDHGMQRDQQRIAI